ncbi:MAG: DUF2254 family protein, partial [Parahaliea sp.]
IGRATRLLTRWAEAEEEGGEAIGSDVRVWFPALDVNDLLDDIFSPLARDGAGLLSVQLRLQKALAALAQLPHPALRKAATVHSRRAWERAEAALAMDFEREALRRVVVKG